jgi:hypothetical protein
MTFDTKIALVIRSDLAPWQKLNVAAFLASGIAAGFPASIGQAYEDASGTRYHALIGQPILIYGADATQLSRALDRAIAREVTAAETRADLNLVGLAFRADRKLIDKVIDGLKFHA